MTTENFVTREGAENLSPLHVEKIEEIKRPKIEITKDGKLSIDGVIQEKYTDVDFDKNPQKNNSDLIQFRAFSDSKREDHNSYIIDVKNPEKELLVISQDKNKTILVNGNKWDALQGKDVYFGGYHVEVDPEGKKVVFRETGHDNESVIVNNVEWKTKFKDGIRFATSRFGTTYALGGGVWYSKLVVDDKEWIYPKSEQGNSAHGDEIRDAVVSKNGIVAGVVNLAKGAGEHVFVGDKIGAKTEWKHGMYSIEKIIIDDKTDTVAVFGQTESSSSKKSLIINDIPYDIEGNPTSLDVFKFEDGEVYKEREGGVLIEYKNALGEKVTERIEVREGAKEIQEQKEKKSSEDRALEDLRRMIAKENIPLEDILKRLKNAEGLEKANEKNKELESQINELSAEKTKLEMGIQNMKKSHEEETRNLEVQLSRAEMVVRKLENILKDATNVTFGSDKKLSADSMKLAMETIQDLRKNNNWTPGT